jgi:hypothetical protein
MELILDSLLCQPIHIPFVKYTNHDFNLLKTITKLCKGLLNQTIYRSY